MISNRFGARVGVVSIDAGVTVFGAACSCGGSGAADKHKLLGVRADFYNIILQSNTCMHGM